MSIIVLEGPDGSGKTTLFNQLREAAGRRYFVMLRHSNRPLTFNDAMRFYDWVNSPNDKMNLVIDRHPMISEPIYGPILRNKDMLDRYSTDELLSMVEKTCTHLVYCRPPYDIIQRGVKAQPQLAGVHEKLLTLVNTYDQAMISIRMKTNIHVFEYDWTNPDQLEDLMAILYTSMGPEVPR